MKEESGQEAAVKYTTILNLSFFPSAFIITQSEIKWLYIAFACLMTVVL